MLSSVKRIEVFPSPAPDRCVRKTFFVLLGRTVKFILLFGIAVVIWHYVGSGPNKAKLHGSIIGVLAGFLALQEFLFFRARERMGETLKSASFHIRELNQLFERVTNLKAYADRLWFVAVPAKMIGLLTGAVLFLGGWPDVLITVKNYPVVGSALLAVIGWFAFLVGLDSTWRTFRVFKHVDAKIMELEVKARQIIAQKAEADEFKSSKDKDENSDSGKYPRIKLPNS